MVSREKVYLLKVSYMWVPKLKTKLLKLLLIDMKANSSRLMRLRMAGMVQNKQKCLIFMVVHRNRVEDQINWIS